MKITNLNRTLAHALIGLTLCLVILSGCLGQTRQGSERGTGQQDDQPIKQTTRQQHTQISVPQEIVSACAGREDNASCQYTMNGTLMNGRCKGFHSKSLVCISITKNNQTSLPDITTPCIGKAENSTCGYSRNRNIVSGICQKGPDEKIMCLPPGRPIP
jgi:hypothetical protein